MLQLSSFYGVVKTAGSKSIAVFERQIPHNATEVWAAITQPGIIAKWLSPNITEPQTVLPLVTGARVKLQYMMAVPEGTITALETGKLLEITWDGNEGNITRWELEDKGDTTILHFSEAVEGEMNAAAMAAFHAYLDFLMQVLDGNMITPAILESWNDISGNVMNAYTAQLNNKN